LAALTACETADDGGGTEPLARVLSGTVVYRERMALPPGATVDVQLEDVSRPDAQAPVLARQSITPGERQVPIPFEFDVPAGAIEPNRRYGLRAAIRGPDGRLLFATTQHHALPGADAPAHGIEILVRRVADGLGGGPWRLVAIQRAGAAEEPVPAEPVYSIEFGADGRFGGQAHCNRFTGGYSTPAEGRLAMTASAATLAACLEPSIGEEFLHIVGAAERYESNGEQLRLATPADATLVFARAPPRAAGAGAAPWADAARRGVTFRALGNEPSWNLEIAPERLTMITELGARRTELPYGEPAADGERTTYRAAGAVELVAVIERRPCNDTMSGEAFEAAATVTFDGTIYYGCGRFL
jgi:putative lipoprotein